MKTFLSFVTGLCCIVHLQGQPKGNTDSEEQFKTLYRTARQKFDRYEKLHGHFTNTRNVRMHYLTWGKESGIPLVWSHGSFTNAYELSSFADSLAAKGYYVIAIDYYGHGQTPIPAHPVSLYHVADDIKHLLDELKIPKAVIGGWSRGGIISTAFYDAYPERVLGLILEDGGSVATNTYYHKMNPDQLRKRVEDLFKDRLPDTTYASEPAAYRANYDTVAKGDQFELLAWIAQTSTGRWAIGPGLLELFNMRTPEQFIANILSPTRTPLFAESMSVIEPKIIYRNLHVPMLILDPTGKDDLFPFEQENRALQKMHPALVYHRVYEDTGHNIHYERPEQFVKDLADFLTKFK